MLEQYTIADILTWLDEKTLVVNRDFQRRAGVWPPAARSYLIDTILRNRPMPRIYVRTNTDTRTRRSFREIVDGQQRINAIRDFSDGRFSLGSNKEVYGDLAGRMYDDLDEDSKQTFLAYLVGVEQLFNASDSEVFDIFQRLNAFTYDLSPQELRHGKYHGIFRNSVVEAARHWAVLWDRYKVVGTRARVRMADDELVAQMFGVVLEGVVDGGQRTIENLYKKYDEKLPSDTVEKVSQTVEFLIIELADILDTGLSGAPHFLMLFAAVAHALFGIPEGGMKGAMPPNDPRTLTDMETARANLGYLADIVDRNLVAVPERFRDFELASAGTTQRIRSRSVRFPLLYKALLPEPIF